MKNLCVKAVYKTRVKPWKKRGGAARDRGRAREGGGGQPKTWGRAWESLGIDETIVKRMKKTTTKKRDMRNENTYWEKNGRNHVRSKEGTPKP